jgi:hypothetical protein
MLREEEAVGVEEACIVASDNQVEEAFLVEEAFIVASQRNESAKQ